MKAGSPFSFKNFPLRPAFLLALLTAVAACSPRQHPALAEWSSRYAPVRIDEAVPANPGSVAWSPDGRYLAFLRRGVTIVDRDTLERRHVPLDRPRSLAWSPDGKIYALSQNGPTTALHLIDPERLSAVQLPLDRPADMLYALDANGLLLAATHINIARIWTEYSWQLARYDIASGATDTVTSLTKTYAGKRADDEPLLAWQHAGLNPLDRSFLLMEQLRPPVVSPYTRVSCIDPLSGTSIELPVTVNRNRYLSADWSPDGRHLALSGMNGTLVILDLRNGAVRALDAPVGVYPSWNPRGSILYFGGSIIRTDGSAAESLLTDAARSFGEWSPDGSRLAIAAGGELLLFSNFVPVFSGPDRPPDRRLAADLALLRSLLEEKLITPAEYDNRRTRLLQKTEEAL